LQSNYYSTPEMQSSLSGTLQQERTLGQPSIKKMLLSRQNRGDNRLWVVLFFAAIILVGTAISIRNQPVPPAPTLKFKDGTLCLTAKNNIIETGRLNLSGVAGAAASPFFFAPVPVNSADKPLLMTLPGIGEGLAGKIIAFRDQHGPIESIEDFARIEGIGKKRLETLQNFITFE